MTITELPVHLPQVGQLVHVRARMWLVDELLAPTVPGQTWRVRLACADDDAQGQTLEMLWDYELDRHIINTEGWANLAIRGFDPPERFAAFLHTLRWNCVTATDPTLFQAPFRAGIKIDAYQMEPLRKALRLPRVNLFIADDTGLGKTIEAALIMRELLLRKKVRTIVVAAPPSVLEQWQAELEERFGLVFVLLDRAYLARMRRERGFGVNPWRTHSRFLVSHYLLSDPTYADPLREWLGTFLPGSLLVLDEAHHAAPASGGRYGIESGFTRAVRDLAGRFEHRLFLSATPHNGHSNSFSTLLELLDPIRFTRGVKVRSKKVLDEVMVRRLKEDIRSVSDDFPRRTVLRIELNDLPADAPELVLSQLLDDYCTLREQRFAEATRRTQAAAALLTVGLQQRLLSSIEAFARSLKVHRATVERQWAQQDAARASTDLAAPLFTRAPDADDERGRWSDAECEAAAAVAAVTAASEAGVPRSAHTDALRAQERALLDRMQRIAEQHRDRPDAKLRYLINWIRTNLCPDLPLPDMPSAGPPPRWKNRRVLIFTENREGTKRFLLNMLSQAIAGSDRADERIEVIDGLTSSTRRQEIQRRFNTDPAHDPLRILLATDAAREGLNFQAHCADLFHFDLPWNPGRIEQRNGRIDRKLQPQPEVRCHYFVLPQRVEDHVLEVLVRKTEPIKRELGSLSQVIDDDEELVAVTARWLDPSQRTGPLTPYARDGEAHTLAVLDLALQQAHPQTPGNVTQDRLLKTAAVDVATLQQFLVPRAELAAAAAIEKLRLRGEQEATELRTTIEQQAKRVREQLDRSRTEYEQLSLEFDKAVARKLGTHRVGGRDPRMCFRCCDPPAARRAAIAPSGVSTGAGWRWVPVPPSRRTPARIPVGVGFRSDRLFGIRPSLAHGTTLHHEKARKRISRCNKALLRARAGIPYLIFKPHTRFQKERFSFDSFRT